MEITATCARVDEATSNNILMTLHVRKSGCVACVDTNSAIEQYAPPLAVEGNQKFRSDMPLDRGRKGFPAETATLDMAIIIQS